MNLTPFHLVIPVKDLALCRRFYKETLECPEGRSSDKWVDFNFYGHQLVIHQKLSGDFPNNQISNPIDGHDVPVPHFEVVLS